MNKKTRTRIAQVMTGVLVTAMIGGLFAGLSKGKVSMPKPKEKITYEDGFTEYTMGDVVELKEFALAAHTSAGWVNSVRTGKKTEIKADEGAGYFMLFGAFQKQYPGILNLYKQVVKAELVVDNDGVKTFPMKVNIDEREEDLSAHTFSSAEEIPWNLYVELPDEYQDIIKKGYTINLIYGNEELAKEAGLKKYRIIYFPETANK